MKRTKDYPLLDGDKVETVKICRCKDYWYCKDYDTGAYHKFDVLPGTPGTVVKAKTPCVTAGSGPGYFANVDLTINGEVFRVRAFHDHFERVTT